MHERLSHSLIPESYDLWIRTDLEKLNFHGEIITDLRVDEAGTTQFRLNVLELEIQKVEIQKLGKDWKEIKDFQLRPDSEDMVVKLNGTSVTLEKGQKYKLKMKYMGILTDKLKGYYKVIQDNGKTGAVCHFEAPGARKAFPCWDEPCFRAKFKITMEHQNNLNLVALSNMPEVRRETLEDNWIRVYFEETQVTLPTYLMCWSLGEYDHITGMSKGGIPVSIYAPINKAEQGRFALDVAIKSLDYFTEFFRVTYKLPKMDLIAVSDFSIGAMENWGILTFRQNYLLVDPENSSEQHKQNVALIVSHEVAHQWFGNYVTIDWWTHLWLKEGYASWIMFLCVDYLFPEWKVWTQFLTDTKDAARTLDILENSHPIEVEVREPAEVDEIFDAISYDKGASIIRMLYNWIGEENFRKGMTSYLDENSFGNASTKDLWRALHGASNMDIDGVMSTWTVQQGFPLLTIQLTEETDEKIRFEVRQSNFKTRLSNEAKAIWKVPLCITSKSSPESHIYKGVMEEEVQNFEFETKGQIEKGDWININPGAIGYFRVKYSGNLLERFVPSIHDMSISADDRLDILSDQMALVQNGLTDITSLLKLIEHYRHDKEVTVWFTILDCLKEMLQLVEQNEDQILEKYNSWVQWLLAHPMKQLVWNSNPENDHLTELFKSTIVSALIFHQDKAIIKEALSRFRNREQESADLRTPIYKAMMRNDPKTSFSTLTRMSLETNSHEEKNMIYRSLGQTDNREVLMNVLEFALGSEVRIQDTRTILYSVAGGSYIGKQLAWQFFQKNANEIKARYKQGNLLIGCVDAVTSGLCGYDMAEEVRQFFQKTPFEGAARTIDQSVEKIVLRSEWKKRDFDAIKNFFLTNGRKIE